MTDELPQEVDRYKFPEKYFRKLREYEDVHEGYYSIVQGGLFRALEDDCRFSDRDAWEVATLLNKHEVQEAEDFIYDQLEAEE